MQNIETISYLQNTFFWQNSLMDYIYALGIFALTLIVFGIFQKVALNRLHKIAKNTKTDIDDTLVKIIKSLRPPFYFFLAFYIGLNFLKLESIIQTILNTVLAIWVVYQVVTATQILIDYLIRRNAKEDDPSSTQAFDLLGKITKGILWVVGVLFILSNLGINITSLVAGLGIGGIAVALAIQNILSDLFSSFAIYFDKPFKVGDFINVNGQVGVVKKIGIKTTRIVALQGEEIVMSNQMLTNATIQNYKKMEDRRIAFDVGVIYETPTEKLKKIPELIKNTIDSVEKVRFDRVHFREFGDFALKFEVVYYVLSPDYNDYMDIQEKINFGIREAFEKEKIEMAYPTQKIFVSK